MERDGTDAVYCTVGGPRFPLSTSPASDDTAPARCNIRPGYNACAMVKYVTSYSVQP